MISSQLHRLLLITFTAVLLGGCGLFIYEQAPELTENIHGTWILEEIRYDNGEILKPGDDEPYWFELKEDSVFAEQEYHYALDGQSFCNPCFGYFDYNEEEYFIHL